MGSRLATHSAVVLLTLGACAHAKMEWPVSALRELPAADTPCESVALRAGEDNQEQSSGPAVDLVGLRWPVYAQAITSHFGVRQDPIATNTVRFHKGIDLSASSGSFAYAAAPGLVVSEGWAGGHGYQVVLDHGSGVRTAYSHLSVALVRRGQRVDEAAAIGVVGDTGRTTGPHLHFEVTINREPMDPFPLLGGRLPTREELAAPAPPRFLFSSVAAR